MSHTTFSPIILYNVFIQLVKLFDETSPSMRLFPVICLLISVSVFPHKVDVGLVKTLLPPQMENSDLVLSKSTSAYSIFSSLGGEGFIIISSGEDDTDISVLGYSDTGIWDEN